MGFPRKIYKCCKCGKTLEDKPIRLVKEVYGAGKYNMLYRTEHYDFCDKCYQIFDDWLKKKR